MRIEQPHRPLVSVVMPLYNNAAEVTRAVNSVLRQTCSSLELIVVNDGSTDGSDVIVHHMDDPRLRVIDQVNKGVSAARNRGFAEAKSEIVAFLDADDEWDNNFLETIDRLVRTFPQCSVFATHYRYQEINGRTRIPILRGLPEGEWEGVMENYFRVAAASDPPLWSSAIAAKKSALVSIGGFPEGIAIGEDLLTWARLALKYQIAYSRRPSAGFRLRAPLVGYPTRIPEIPDLVGRQIWELLSGVPPSQQNDFRRYAAMWHRMRASMFVRLGLPTQALEDVRKMRYYRDKKPHVAAYYLLAKTPKILMKFILQIFTFVQRVRRAYH